MSVIRVKHLQTRHGRVATVLPWRGEQEIADFGCDELAQLAADLLSLPQPHLRPREADNLARLVLWIGGRAYRRFSRRVAVCIMTQVSAVPESGSDGD